MADSAIVIRTPNKKNEVLTYSASQLFEKISDITDRAISYCCFKEPGSPLIHVIVQRTGTVPTYTQTTDIPDAPIFLIAPFQTSNECPIVAIRQDEHYQYQIPDDAINCPDHIAYAAPDSGYETYSHDFRRFMKPLATGQFKKIVLSRRLEISAVDTPCPIGLFIRASQRYPRQFVALYNSKQTGTWLTATPELLVSCQNGQWNTMALAGTVPAEGYNTDDELGNWNHKNREEQALVVHYIKEKLSSLSDFVKENPPKAIRAADVMHLCSKIEFAPKPGIHLGQILESLHPTPAVCGYPQAETKLFIDRYEQNKRDYYAGYAGYCSPESTSLYVSLRCMQINPSSYSLYAGGGLLPESEVHSEWKETAYKMNTMLNLLIKD